jgi:hypothetical protein
MSRVQAAARPAHRRHHADQRAWIIFGGRADHAWQRWLKRGFRHCFAAIEDEAGWLVLDPLSGRLLLGRVQVPPGYDLPGFYGRAGLTAVGPFALEDSMRGASLGWMPLTCVALCRAVLGPQAPFALTPAGLYRGLCILLESRKKNLTCPSMRM